MKSVQSNESMLGGIAAVSAYVIWGILPIYWKLIDDVPAIEVLAHRIIWSFVFMIFVLLITRRTDRLADDMKGLLGSPKRLLIITGASIAITMNWYTFIWAVSHGHVVQASLGYYINPLVSVLLGIFFLKEKLSMWQMASFGLALCGVLLMTFQVGVFPWVSLALAVSFGLYGLLKKTVHLPAMTGLAIETSLMTPVAFIYLVLSHSSTGYSFSFSDTGLAFLLIGTGMITAIPLLLFAAGANRISLAMVGFFQYIAPTIMLFLGTLVYHEPFNHEHLISFIMIWLSLILFTLARTKWFIRAEDRMLHRGQKSYAK